MPKVLITEIVSYAIDIPDEIPRDEWEDYWLGINDINPYFKDCHDRQFEEL